MTLSLLLSRSVRRACDSCGKADPAGGVRMQDDTGATRVLCRRCAKALAAACVEAMPGPVDVEAEPEDERHWVRQAPDRSGAGWRAPAG